MALNANMGLGFLFQAKDLASGVMQRVSGNLGQLQGVSADASMKMQRAFQGVGASLGLVGAGAAGLSVLGAAASEATAFSAKIAEVATEADLAKFSTDEMRKITQGLGEEFGKLPIEEAEALYKAVAFGAGDAASANALMTGSNLLARAGVTDVGTAMNAVAGTAKAYGKSFDASTDISDAFFKAMTLGNTKVADLANALPRVTGQAASLAVGYDTLLAATSTLTGKNIEAGEAVSGLKAAFANVQKPTADAEKEAKRLGITFSATALRSMGLRDFLGQITTNAKFTDDTFTELFGSIEGVNAITQLTTGGMKDFDQILGAMTERTGATKKGFDIMRQEGAFAFDQLKSTGAVALEKIGEVVVPAIVGITRAITGGLKVFNMIPGPLRAILVGGVALASGLAIVTGGVLFLTASFVLLSPVLAAAGTVLGVLAVAMIPVLGAMGLVAAGVAGLRVAMDRNIGGFGDRMTRAFGQVRLAFRAIAELFSSGEISAATTKELSSVENGAVFRFVDGISRLFFRAKSIITEFQEGFSQQMAFAEPAIKGLISAVESLVGKIFGLTEGKTAFDGLGASGKSMGELVGQAATLMIDGLTGITNAVIFVIDKWHTLEEIGGRIVTSLTSIAKIAAVVGVGFLILAAQAAITSSGMGLMAFALGGGLVPVLTATAAAAWATIAPFVAIVAPFALVGLGALALWNIFKEAFAGITEEGSNFYTFLLGLAKGIVRTLTQIADTVAGVFGFDTKLTEGVDAKFDEWKKLASSSPERQASATQMLEGRAGGGLANNVLLSGERAIAPGAESFTRIAPLAEGGPGGLSTMATPFISPEAEASRGSQLTPEALAAFGKSLPKPPKEMKADIRLSIGEEELARTVKNIQFNMAETGFEPGGG